MAADTIPLLLDLEVPLTLVESLVKQHVLAALSPNGHASRNGQDRTLQEKETPAPVVTAATGAP
jgi:hypothetical protein